MKWKAFLATIALTAACVPALTFAQAGGGGGGNGGGGAGGGGGGGGRGNRQPIDPAQFQAQMLDRIKTQLAAADDEWKVIEPKITKVLDAQREARAGGGGFGRGGRGGGPGGAGGGGPGGGGPNAGAPAPTTEAGRAQLELETALQNATATPDDITKKLAAFREARDKARNGLETARKDLKEVLTAKQEAQLVVMGLLE